MNGIKKKIRNVLRKVLLPFKFILLEVVKDAEKESYNPYLNGLVSKIPFIGEGVNFNGKVVITDPSFVALGSNVHIGDNAYLNTFGGLTIGDNTHISRNVTIYTANHNHKDALPYNDEFITKPVIIKENVWIGMNVSITPGVTIGKGAIIGMGSVITKNVPDYCIVGNQSYRILNQRNVDEYKQLKKENKIGGINGKLLIKTNNYVSGKELKDKMFFVLSTGRAGSKSISHILSQHPDVECKHEISDQLIRLSTDYAHKHVSRDYVKEYLEEIYVNNRYYKKDIWFGESNQKLSNLVEILQEILPEAKFIWLLRDGRKVIPSIIARGWYDDSININKSNSNIWLWHKYRLKGDLCGEFSSEEWGKMSYFERTCWYWAYWNEIISEQFNKIDNNKKYILRVENLNDAIKDISKLLNLPNFNFINVKENTAVHKIIPFEKWSNSELNIFKNRCGDLMNRFYKEWDT